MLKYLITLSSVWLFLTVPVFVQAQVVEVISPELRGAIQPQVAVTSKGNIFVTFGKGDRIYCASSLDNAKTFLPARVVARLPELALGMRRGPRIVVASDNQIVVSAVSQQDGNLYAWTSRDGGQTWSKGMVVNSVPNAVREGLHGVAGDGQGNVYAVSTVVFFSFTDGQKQKVDSTSSARNA